MAPSLFGKLFTKAAPETPAPEPAAAPGRTTTDVLDSKYQTGQVWNYRSRPHEPESTFTVVKVENGAALGDIVHISVHGLKMKRADGGLGETIGHMPFAVKSIDESVTGLAREGAGLPDFSEGYGIWRAAFEAGKAGVFTTSVAEAVDFIEQAMQ